MPQPLLFDLQDRNLPEAGLSSDTPEAPSSRNNESSQVLLLSRTKLLKSGARAAVAALGAGLAPGGAWRGSGLAAGVPVAAGGWGLGLGKGVHSAQAFGGPSRPLNRCVRAGVPIGTGKAEFEGN